MRLNPYLHFNGNCEQAIRFYEKVLRGKAEMHSFEGSPMAGEVPPDWRKKIMHAHVAADGVLLMATDAPPGRYTKPQGFSVSLAVDTPEEAERIFNALADNGQVGMPMAETFFARKFGMLTDQFGIPWMVICEKPM